MISKGTIRYIKSLQLKKYRKKAQSFLVEGTKSVLELLKAPFELTHLVATESFIRQNEQTLAKLVDRIHVVTEKQLNGMSSLKTNDKVLAVAKCLPNEPFKVGEKEYVIALDQIRDPGNLGAIIRTADWYGITKIICSLDCADLYHPKVIHASMGSFIRVKVYYTELPQFIGSGFNVYGATLNGENVHSIRFKDSGVLIIGNETRGISASLKPIISQEISVPRLGGAESLNASIATAVICDNIFREL